MSSKTLKASVLIGGSITSSFRSALGTTKDGLRQIGEAIANVDRRQRLLGQSINTFARMGKNVDGLRQQYAALTRESDRLRAAQQRLATTQAAVDRNMDRRANLRGRLGGAVGAALAVAVPVGSMANNAAKFQHANQLIGNTANMTAEQIKALGQVMLRTSKETNQMTDDVQRAVGFLVAAGMDIDTAKRSIRAIGRTTTATGADIEDLSKASFTLIDALKIKPEGLQQALDILAVAGKEGNVELRDMAKTLPALGGSFVALKMTGTEAAATMGAALEIARKGAGDADEAANNMRNFMAKILSPETLKKAQKNFGLDLYAVIQSAQKNGGNPFEAAMQAIMKATAGDQKKIGQLFQDMQVQNFLRPMIQNWNEYKRIKDQALNHSSGTTDRDFEKMMGTASEQMKAAKAAADRFAKTLGVVLLPSIGDAASKMGAFLDKATAFVEKHPKLVGGIVKAAVAFTALRVATLGIGYAMTFVKGPFLSVMNFIAKWRAAGAVAAMGRFGGMALRIVGIVRNVGMAIAAVGAGPVAVIVGALVVGALVVRKYWEPIKAWFTGFFEGIQSAVGPAFAELGTALAPLKPVWDAIASAVGAAWNWFMKLIEPVKSTSAELAGATESGRSFGQVVGGVLSFLIGRVTTMIQMFTLAKNVIGQAVEWIANKAEAVIGTARAIGGYLGITPTEGTAGAGAGGRTPPQISNIRRGAGGSVSNQNTFNITQQPGESSEALAERVAKHLDRRQGVQQRGALTDGAH